MTANDTRAPQSELPEEGLLGSGLGSNTMAGVLAVSVLVFLFWGGPLWTSAPGASHVLRIALSYLMILPMAAALLWRAHRWSVGRLVSSVGLLWSAKLVLTASLYSLLTPSAEGRYTPAPAVVASAAARPIATAGYRPSAPGFKGERLSGIVVDGDRPIRGAAVFLDRPSPGRPLPAARDLALAVGRPGLAEMVIATPDDRLLATNGTDALHTLQLSRDGQVVINVPLPPGAPPRLLAALDPGAYEWSCAVHAGERGALFVFDHPYSTITDDAGRFTLSDVPAGAAVLVAQQAGTPPKRVALTINAAALERTINLRSRP